MLAVHEVVDDACSKNSATARIRRRGLWTRSRSQSLCCWRQLLRWRCTGQAESTLTIRVNGKISAHHLRTLVRRSPDQLRVSKSVYIDIYKQCKLRRSALLGHCNCRSSPLPPCGTGVPFIGDTFSHIASGPRICGQTHHDKLGSIYRSAVKHNIETALQQTVKELQHLDLKTGPSFHAHILQVSGE